MLRFVVASTVVLAVASVACQSGGNDASGAAIIEVGQPCSISADCATGICIPKIGETITPTNKGVCTVTCSGSDACLAGWTCLATAEGRDLCQCGASAEVCDGRDNDCNGVIDDAPNGLCGCPTSVCAGACVDTQTNAAHCGGCGLACPPGSPCVNGLCTCANGLDPCNDACTDTKKDPKNCGSCGTVCGPDTTCVEGACRCGVDGSGEACVVGNASSGTSRTFCRLDGKCRVATKLALGISCSSNIGYVSAPNGVAAICSTKSSDVYLVPTTGGSLTCGGGQAPGVVTDGTTIFERNFGGSGAIILSSCSASGNSASFPTLPGNVQGIGVGAGFAYWGFGGKLYRCPITGCADPTQPTEIGPLVGINEIDVDASGVYARAGDTIQHIDPVSGDSTTIADVAGVTAVVLDGDRLLLTTPSGISSCAKSGCGSTPAPFVSQTGVESVTADATRVWWKAGDSVYACAKDAPCTQPTLMLTGVATLSIGADDVSLYVGLEKIPK